jgi:hypothetical protein
MQQLFYSVAVLACPIGMGLMMWMMMRGQRNNTAAGSGPPDDSGQVARLRAEIEQLKAERAKDAR